MTAVIVHLIIAHDLLDRRPDTLGCDNHRAHCARERAVMAHEMMAR